MMKIFITNKQFPISWSIFSRILSKINESYDIFQLEVQIEPNDIIFIFKFYQYIMLMYLNSSRNLTKLLHRFTLQATIYGNFDWKTNIILYLMIYKQP